MRYILFLTIYCSMVVQAFALSCMPPEPGSVMNSADLIAKAEIVNIKKPFVKDMLEQPHDQLIEFKILQIYKSDVTFRLPTSIQVSFSSFMQTWGPDLKTGEVGEFMFRHEQERGWIYAGPGGCSYLDEAEWEKLRQNAQ